MSIATKTVLIERMNGFDAVVQNLVIPDIEIIYTDFPAIVRLSQESNPAVGAVKGPRGTIGKGEFERFASINNGFVISYVGRHPEKVIEPDTEYDLDNNNSSIAHVHTENGDVPVLSMETSPLSSAVASYITAATQDILSGKVSEIETLFMVNGNTFSKRQGHTFNPYDVHNKGVIASKQIGVIGAGDVGSRAIKMLDAFGASITYNAGSEKSFPGTSAVFIPDMKDLLASNLDVLSLHLPSKVNVPLEDLAHVKLFINSSSGANIDELELIRAIEEGRIKTALIDVFKHEGDLFGGKIDPKTNRFVQSPLNPFPHTQDDETDKIRKAVLNRLISEGRLFLTPHIAYLEDSALRDTIKIAVEKIINYQSI